EWQTASQVERSMAGGTAREVWRRMWPVVAFSILIVAAIVTGRDGVREDTSSFIATLPFALLWLGSPALAAALSRSIPLKEFKLSDAEKQALLKYSQLHWT